MVRLVAAMKVFNEIWHIEKAVKGVRGVVDCIIAIDGAWKHYPGGLPWSDDGTKELLIRENVEIHGGTLWDNQPLARTEYFKYGRLGDWFLVFDADYEIECEVDIGEWIERNLTGMDNTGWVTFIDDETLSLCYFPLLIKWEEGLRYGGNHYSLCVGENKRVPVGKRVPGVTIHHCHRDKPKEKKDNMKRYSEWRRDRSWKEK
ncbi:MAG: hypothetical protein KAJ19_26645 [Gammaproteobacteria bacterium]|nr:hypothetical protein [Gammaproteobacteria bacterium]